MQTTIMLDTDLVAGAVRIFGGDSEQEAVESALKAAMHVRRQSAIRELRGIGWEGDLEEMRLDTPRRTID
ncbi:type II toxin-antitoxin system VapB family antitoxin [Sphingomonas sp. KR1UV-12]|uniref:Type II toxin-antitoxin system VapB family antitoxin n=1 Tax=Sphingomonas aurea TaxID=3063994 RepID=A0ABT9EIY1_9SPHN|nr:type II toxin-antitoxin system VapB family antitoxin [Sphingomonas sp. KR1UV-12]MDP1026919.1 type II toxin-antitoxin system VapB family antitoxin [Sphingomonas sp. KR1UV-12]